MTAINLKQARQRLGELVSAAERGEVVVITRRGKKVARLVPVGDATLRALPDLTVFRASLDVTGRSLGDEVLAQRREERH